MRASLPTQPRRPQRGLSLIESLAALSIVASSVAAVAPGITQWRAQLAVQQAAAEFETDVHFARSLALTRNDTLRMAFDAADNGQCWVLHTGPRDACRCSPQGEPVCTADGVAFRQGVLGAGQPVRLETNVGGIAFEATHGTASPAATVRFTAAGAKPVHQVVGILGRVRSCVPGGGLSGYRKC